MKYYEAFEKTVHKISGVFIYLSAAALFLMMMLTTADVIGRYILNSPIKGTQDLVELGLVVCAFAGLGYVTLHRQHIRADMINAVLSKRKNAILSSACFAISIPVAIALAWQTCAEGFKVFVAGKAGTPTISVPIGPFFLFAGLGLILLCVEILLDVIRYIHEARKEEYLPVDDEGIKL
jgi:TRAP-type C4-dicarboxylate transport system permease small subunit